jgi:GntR family transcriptional regulator, carbon starvation induced regulator
MAAGKRVQRATLTTQIEDAIRSDIVDGTLRPGQRLAAIDLSERYGVSATPLREALQRMAAESLVQLDPRLGATVAPISRDHLHDTYRVREVLECLALQDSIEAADDAWESRLCELFSEFQGAITAAHRNAGSGDDDVSSWSQAHRAFHDGLLANCKSQWLKDLLAILSNHTERYRMLSARTGLRDSIAEHASIFAAAVARDQESAVAALRSHLGRTVEMIESTVYVEPPLKEETALVTAGGPEAAEPVLLLPGAEGR